MFSTGKSKFEEARVSEFTNWLLGWNQAYSIGVWPWSWHTAASDLCLALLEWVFLAGKHVKLELVGFAIADSALVGMRKDLDTEH